MRLAVIGAGYWGKNHIRDYLSLGHEVTVCDLNREQLGLRKKEFPGIKTMAKLEDILNDKGIRGASVCVPNELHFPVAEKLLNAGKNVLVEKPMALSSEECRKLIELAKEKNLLLAVGHIFRFNSALRKLKEMIDANEFGKIYLIKLTWANLEPIFFGREVLFDLAPHAFDMVNFLTDKNFDEISCIGEGFRRNVTEAAFINAKIGKILVNLEISWVTPKKTRTLALVGERKSAFIDCLTQEFELFDAEKKETIKLDVAPSNSLREELVDFTESIEKDSRPFTDGETGFGVVKAIEYAVKSMNERRTLRLQD